MPDIRLSLAMSYYDHVSDLVRGKVRVEGVTLMPSEFAVEEIFFRMIMFSEWDIAECSMAKYVGLVGTGSPPFRAIPVFPSRVFRQSSFYISPRSGVKGPGDLVGRRVGIPEWAQTAGIYARAYLQHQCGISPRDINWVQAGVNEPGRVEKVKLDLPDGVNIERVSDRSLNEMLIAGDLDAMISAREPKAFIANDPRIARLWPDYRALEESYFRETGIFPIMHAVVIKSDTLKRYPWVAMNLYKAFEEAKKNSLRQVFDLATSSIPFAWSHQAALEARKVFGEDCWPYGIEPNRKTLEAFCQYCHEQGVTKYRVPVEDLFPRELTRFARV